MMQNIKRMDVIASVLALALLFAVAFSSLVAQPAKAIGTNPVENYLPVVKYNEGIYTALPITTTMGITAASLTNTGAATIGTTLGVTGAATLSSTLSVSGASTLATTTVEHFTGGGRVLATSTNDTSSTGNEEELRVARIDITPNVPGITHTLVASSSITNLIPNSGDWVELVLTNATSTAGSDGAFTLAAGAGMNFKNASSSLVFRSGNATRLFMQREPDTDITVFLDPR